MSKPQAMADGPVSRISGTVASVRVVLPAEGGPKDLWLKAQSTQSRWEITRVDVQVWGQ
jgi:hypothetical protein